MLMPRQAERMPKHLITVSYGLPRKGLPAAASVRRWATAAIAGQRRVAELAVRYVDSAEGRALNRDYRDKDYATNVLSFPVDLPKGVRSALLGDLVICAPVVALEALGQDKPLAHHHAHLVVHGVLHLLGMDHERSEADAHAMEARERRILAGLGIPDPYAER